jgi:glyoxylase-like metal-dependent hydrolase (beta-lactamase superfamily II)
VHDLAIGELRISFLSDGVFRPRPKYFGPDACQVQFEGLFDTQAGELADLPIGCFLIRGHGERVVLVDAGMGPAQEAESPDGPQDQDPDSYGELRGGSLPGQLNEAGVLPQEITDVIVTHLHQDHYGWLVAPGDGEFREARIWLDAAEYEYFLGLSRRPDFAEQQGSLSPAYMHRLGEHRAAGRVQLLDDDVDQVTELVQAIRAPGHTPGHRIVSVQAEGRRLLLLGDSATCPIQVAQPSWHSYGDVDVELAQRTRDWVWAQLQQPGTLGVGAHFPGLVPGFVDAGTPAGSGPTWRASW